MENRRMKKMCFLLMAGCMATLVSQGGVVLSDTFSGAAGVLDGQAPDIGGGNWSGNGNVVVTSSNTVDTVATDYHEAFVDFTDALGAGEVLTLEFDTFGGLVGAWAGISLYDGGNERMFAGQPGALFWGKDGGAIGGQQYGMDNVLNNHLVLTYAYDSGAWTFRSDGYTTNGTGMASLPLDRLRIASGGDGFIILDNLSVDISPVGKFSFVGQAPADGSFSVVVDSPTISVQATDGASPVNTDSVVMMVDDVMVVPNVAKEGNVTTISYVPSTPLSYGSEHSVEVVLTENDGTEHTNTWRFTTGHQALPVTLPGPVTVAHSQYGDAGLTIMNAAGEEWIGSNYDTSSSKTVYTRFSMCFDDLNEETGDGGGYGGLHFFRDNNATDVLLVGNNWASLDWSIDHITAADDALTPASYIRLGEWHTIVIRTDYKAGEDDVTKIWMDPDFDLVEAAQPNAPLTVLGDTSFDSIRLRCGNGSASATWSNIIVAATSGGVGFVPSSSPQFQSIIPRNGAASAAVSTPVGAEVIFGTYAISSNDVTLSLDGSNVSPSFVVTSNSIALSYQPDGPFEAGSTHDVSLRVIDANSDVYSTNWTFSAELYPVLPVTLYESTTGTVSVTGGGEGTTIWTSADSWLGDHYGDSSSETLYTRFTIKFDDLNAETGSGGGYGGLHFFRDDAERTIVGNSWAAAAYSVSAEHSGAKFDLISANSDRSDGFEHIDTEPHFLLGRIDFHAGADDDLTIWLDPDPRLDEASQSASLMTSVGAFADLSFDSIHLRSGNSDPWEFDEMRFGTGWASVLPAVYEGNLIRVQPLSDRLVRIELRGLDGFEDRETFTVVDREWPEVPHTVTEEDGATVVTTDRYTVRVPANACSLNGIRIEDTATGTLIHELGPGLPGNEELPAPGDSRAAWLMADSPRLVPPEWGATPPADDTDPQSGWDSGNDAPDVYVFLMENGADDRFREDFLHLTGPVPLPPLKTFGLWDSRYHPYTEESALEVIDTYRSKSIPLDMFVVDTDWRVGASDGYAVDTDLFPDMSRFLASAHSRNVEVMFNDHPEPIADTSLDPAELQYRWEGLTSLFDMGADVWWYDRNWWTTLQEPVPGIQKEVWGMRLYHDMTERYAPERRPLIMTNVDGIDNGAWNNPSHPAAHRFPIWWSGDVANDWSSLRNEIGHSVNGGILRMMPYLHPDCGGHTGTPSNERYVRWVQFGAFSPVFRLHCTAGEIRYPWAFGEEAEAIASEYVRLRYRLMPMIYSAAARAAEDGTPLLRRCDLEWSAYSEASGSGEYLFGDDLLVVPVTSGTTVSVIGNGLLHTMENGGEAGLAAQYFDNMDLSGAPVFSGVDASIDFDWGTGSPDDNVPADAFSARWSGWIGPFEKTETKTFAISVDDGVRVWIDGQLVIDSWIDQALETYKAAVDVTAGESLPVRIEYFENGGDATCRFGEASADTTSAWIPPGNWHDLWTGETVAGPATIEVPVTLWKTPLFAREGAAILSVPPMQYTDEQPWTHVVLDAFVPAEGGDTTRMLYEDDGASVDYQTGASRSTAVHVRNDAGNIFVNVDAAVGSYSGAPGERAWTLRVQLPAGSESTGILLDGMLLTEGEDYLWLEPDASDSEQVLPLAGAGSVPRSQAGPIAEVSVPSRSVTSAIELCIGTFDADEDGISDHIEGNGDPMEMASRIIWTLILMAMGKAMPMNLSPVRMCLIPKSGCGSYVSVRWMQNIFRLLFQALQGGSISLKKRLHCITPSGRRSAVRPVRWKRPQSSALMFRRKNR